MPQVSVIMSVFNGARYLREAVDSILGQTFADFEFIVIDDGSVDETAAILNSYSDPRIVRLANQVNIGLTKSLNRGLSVAQGKYVARQDADDWSSVDRLARQVAYLEKHPQIALVGTAYTEVYEDGSPSRVVRMPAEHTEIRDKLFYENCFCHGSVMVRRSCLEEAGEYDERFDVAQDLELWLRLAEAYLLSNLPDPLYFLRTHSASVTGRFRQRQGQAACQATKEAMKRYRSRSSGWQPLPLTSGRYHFSQALQALADDREDCARQHMEAARAENPQLDDDVEYLLSRAVYRAFEQGTVETRHIRSSEDARAGLDYICRLFALLPAGLARMRLGRRWTLSEMHAAYAFAAFDSARRSRVWLHCLRAWWYQPTRLANRGLLSIWIQSLIPGRLEAGRAQ